MSTLRPFSALLPTLLLAAVSGTAQAQPGKPAFMPAGDIADAPGGFSEMCRRDAVLCMEGQARAGEGRTQTACLSASPLTGTARVMTDVPACIIQASWQQPAATADAGAASNKAWFEQAKLVNSAVNRTIHQVSDRALRGVDEYWARPQGAGDCEDLAIEKRVRLLEAGFPAERTFYAVSFLPGYGLHTVLIVRLDDGDYVLDSLSPRVMRWSKTHYVWLRQQEPGQPLVWRRVSQPSTAFAEVHADTDDATAS